MYLLMRVKRVKRRTDGAEHFCIVKREEGRKMGSREVDNPLSPQEHAAVHSITPLEGRSLRMRKRFHGHGMRLLSMRNREETPVR